MIDVATLKPLDFDTVLGSVARTGRCVIVHEAPRTGGFGAEIAARARRGGPVLAAGARRAGHRHPTSRCRCRASSTHYLPGDARHPRGGAPGGQLLDERLQPAGSRRGPEGSRDRHLARRRGRPRRGRPAAGFGRDRQGRGRDPGAACRARSPSCTAPWATSSRPGRRWWHSPTRPRPTPAPSSARSSRERPKPAAPRHRASVGGRRRRCVGARRSSGVDIAKVEGTGPDGMITLGDVEKAARARRRRTRPAAARRPPGDGEQHGALARRGGARNRHRRGRHRRLEAGTTSRCGWCARSSPAARAVPALNAWFLGETEGRLLHQHDRPRHRHRHARRPVRAGAAERRPARRRRSAARARADEGRRARPQRAARGAASAPRSRSRISACSAAGYAQMVILPPQVAIVGAGRIRDDLRILGGAIRITARAAALADLRPSRGHGREAARFLAALVADLELHTYEPAAPGEGSRPGGPPSCSGPPQASGSPRSLRPNRRSQRRWLRSARPRDARQRQAHEMIKAVPPKTRKSSPCWRRSMPRRLPMRPSTCPRCSPGENTQGPTAALSVISEQAGLVQAGRGRSAGAWAERG